MKESQKARFLGKIGPPDESGCRLWTGAKNNTGYGAVSIGGKLYAAHRLSYALSVGIHPLTGLSSRDYICHRCDVRLCCAPDHLFIGTGKDNAIDAARKRRTRTSDPRATEELVRRIRAMTVSDMKDNRFVGALMVETGMSQIQIRRIQARKWYQRIP